MTAEGVSAIMNLTLVPYGNARGTPPSVTCQHGPNECTANMFEACAINMFPGQDNWWPFVHCLESSDTPYSQDTNKKCIEDAGLDWDRQNHCTSDANVYDKYVAEMANKTNSLDPPHQWTPWVTIYNAATKTNIAPLEDVDNILAAICKAYPGTPPAGCSDASIAAFQRKRVARRHAVCYRD